MALNMKELMAILPQTGKVEWIGIRPIKRGAVEVVESVSIDEKNGIEGDHYSREGGKRMVTLIQQEHIQGVASMLQQNIIDPKLLRRNIVVSGINLLALKDKQFQIGDALILEMTGNCHPCSRMETNLGAGGYNAMRGHGGITAKVVRGGIIKLGDSVKAISS